MKDRRLFLSLRIENRGFLLTFCNQNGGFLLTFRTKDGLTALTLCLHLLLHGILNRCRRHNVLKLHTVDLDAPWVGGNVERFSHLRVDRLSGGQCLVEFQITDNVTESGCR